MNNISDFTPEIHNLICENLNLSEKINLSLSAPFGKNLYLKMLSDPEFWIKRIEEKGITPPKEYLNKVQVLERISNVLDVITDETIEQKNLHCNPLYVNEMFYLLDCFLKNTDKKKSSRTLVILSKVLVEISFKSLEVVFQLLYESNHRYFAIDSILYYSIFEFNMSKLLFEDRINEARELVILAEKFIGKQELRFSFEVCYKNYGNGLRIKKFFQELNNEGYKMDFSFNKEDVLEDPFNETTLKEDYYFPEYSDLIVRRIKPFSKNGDYVAFDLLEKKPTSRMTLNEFLYVITKIETEIVVKYYDLDGLGYQTEEELVELMKESCSYFSRTIIETMLENIRLITKKSDWISDLQVES